MTLLTYIQHPRHAQALVDYLNTLGIKAQTQDANGTVAILLQDSTCMAQAQDVLAQFLAEPDHARYQLASWQLGAPTTVSASLKRLYFGPSIWLALKNTGVVTQWVFGLCLLLFLYTGQGENVAARAPFMFFPDLASMADSREYWRWLTPALIHFGMVHFVFNMFSWWVFGGIIERSQSSTRLLGILLTCALAGNWVEFFWSRDNFGGLSGVVYGLLGYLWFYGRFNPNAPVALPSGMVALMLFALAFGFTNLLPIANMAHLGGLLTGCLLGFGLAKLDMMEE